jgi:hypothetical protein
MAIDAELTHDFRLEYSNECSIQIHAISISKECLLMAVFPLRRIAGHAPSAKGACTKALYRIWACVLLCQKCGQFPDGQPPIIAPMSFFEHVALVPEYIVSWFCVITVGAPGLRRRL